MLKRLFGEYIEMFFCRSIKEMSENDRHGYFFSCYWIVVTYCILISVRLENGGDDFGEIVMLLCVFIPMLFVIFSAAMHPLSLPKQMYLCPMSSKERKKYIVQSYYFRIILHITVCAAGVVIMIPFTRHSIFSYVQILLNDFILSTLTESYGQNNSEKRQVCKMVIIPMVMLFNLIQLIVLSDMENAHTMITVVQGIVYVLVELPLLYFYCKDVKKQIEAAVFYE